jgi:hypothetical protein
MSSSSPRNANPHSRKAGSAPATRKRTQEVETPEGNEAGLPDGASVDPSEAVTPAHGLAKPTATTALQAAEESVLAATTHAAEKDPPSDHHGDQDNDNDSDGDDRDHRLDLEAAQAQADAQPEARGDEPAPEQPAAPNNGQQDEQPVEAQSIESLQSVESFVGAPDASPLNREIQGAAEDMAGEWSAQPRPMPGAAPSTPLDMLDETELVEDGPTVARNGLHTAPAKAPLADDEFLRRVVLPPLPQQPGSGALPRTYSLAEDSGDKTVISDPPSPEMLANLMGPSRATAAAIKQRLSMPVELTAIELFGLLTGSAVIGGIIGALFLSVPQAAANRPAPAPAAVVAPAPEVKSAPAPAVVPLPPMPRPTIEPLPPPTERVAPEDSEITARPATTSKRSRRAVIRKQPKREFVDPFEQ